MIAAEAGRIATEKAAHRSKSPSDVYRSGDYGKSFMTSLVDADRSERYSDVQDEIKDLKSKVNNFT